MGQTSLVRAGSVGGVWRKGAVLGLALVGACAPGEDPAFRSGSSNMAMSADAGELFVADPDNGTVMRVNVNSGAIESFVAGLEPTRIAQVGSELWVTLRAQGQVAIIKTTADGMTLADQITVGGEPYGIVVAPDGEHVYVALSVANRVVEIDTKTHEITRKFALDHQPRWLAIHNSGETLFVGCGMAGTVYEINLASGEIQEVTVPVVDRGDMVTGEVNPTKPRVTGDPAISPSGGFLAVPLLYVDSSTSVGPADPEGGDGGVAEGPNKGGGDGYAAGDPEGMTRFNPAVVVFELSANGHAKPGTATAVLVSGTAARSSDDEVLTFDNFDTGGRNFDVAEPPDMAGPSAAVGISKSVRGYLTSLTFAPDGNTIFATVEGGAAVAVVPTHPVVGARPRTDSKDPFEGDGAFTSTTRMFVGTDEGTTGLVLDRDGNAWTWNFLGRSVSRFNSETTTELMEAAIDSNASGPTGRMFAGVEFQLEPSILSADVLEGRRLFYSSSDSAMAAAGAGVSCASCHFEGRNDGLTWMFDSGVRQTPSLAGRVSQTTPITWTNSVPSVEREVFLTSQGRMGGHGLVDAQMAQVSSYIDWSRAVVPVVEDAAAVARGKGVFERADTACATCHSSERKTDNQSYPMLGELSVNTPSLVGVAATGPYFHDGSSASLADVIRRADEVGMGRTSQLSAAERKDLEAYLRSL